MTIIGLALYEKGKTGSLIMSRQFLPMCKTRLDAILFAFPKLHHISSHDSNYIDGESIRYVFQNAFNIVFVLITNLQSDLIQDLHTLQFVSRLIYTICLPEQYYAGQTIPNSHLTTSAVRKRQYEVCIAIDEVIEPGGYMVDPAATIESVHMSLLMESHEEHRYNLLQKEKMKDAKVVALQKAQDLDRQKRMGTGMSNDPAMAGRIVGIGSSSMQSGSYGNDTTYNAPQDDHNRSQPHSPTDYARSNNSSIQQQQQQQKQPDIAKFEFTSTAAATKPTVAQNQHSSILGKSTGRKLGGGKSKMVLGKKKDVSEEDHSTTQQTPSNVSQPDYNSQQSTSTTQPASTSQQQQQQQSQSLAELHIPHTKIEERITVQMDTENTITQFSITGKLSLLLPDTIAHPNYAVQVHPSITSLYPNVLKLQTRPGLDKTQWTSNAILYNTDQNKPFLPGIDKPNILLQWRVQSNNNAQLASLVPLSFALWVSQSGPNATSISLECSPNQTYTASPHTTSVYNIIIAIPCPLNPSLTQVGQPWKYDQTQRMLYWSLGSLLTTADQQLDKTPPGAVFNAPTTIEFEVQGAFEQETFLPMNLTFSPQSSYIGVQPVTLYDTTTSQPVEFGTISSIILDGFSVTGQ